MKTRLYRVFCFWRNHGSKLLIHQVLFKLKLISKPAFKSTDNPYEISEPNSARESTNRRFASCIPLRVYTVPPDKIRRISIVTDSINSGSLYGGVGTAIIMAALLAEERQSRLRVITRTERAQAENLAHVLEIYGIRLLHEVEFVFAPNFDRYFEIDIFQDEYFITTSWWTTSAMMGSVAHHSIIYLLQEDERMFYPAGDDYLRCAKIMNSKEIRFVINTKLLFDHLIVEGFDNIADNGIYFEPAFPKQLFYPRLKPELKKRTLMFYARPNNLRNLYYFGIELIENAIAKGVIDLSRWEIKLVGKDIPDVVFTGGYQPQKCENLVWSEYAKLVGQVDLGICLMYTPHPSYPPLDLAASGAVVVTNKFRNKRSLNIYSKNIICGDLDQDVMMTALAEGIHLAENENARSQNYRSNELETDWRAAFTNTLKHFTETK